MNQHSQQQGIVRQSLTLYETKDIPIIIKRTAFSIIIVIHDEVFHSAQLSQSKSILSHQIVKIVMLCNLYNYVSVSTFSDKKR